MCNRQEPFSATISMLTLSVPKYIHLGLFEGTFCVVPAHKEHCVCVCVHVGEIPLFHARKITENVMTFQWVYETTHFGGYVRGVEIAFPGSFSTVGT